MVFAGFSEAGLSFLTELGTRDKVWMEEHRATYFAEVAEPAKAFVAVLGDVLSEEFSPEIVAIPKVNGSISPINNDVRFSPDATPYKDHLLFRFWEGSDKKASPTLFIRVSQDHVGFAAGAAIASIEEWRRLVADGRSGGALSEALRVLAVGRTLDVVGEALKRVPKPYSEDHVRAHLLRHKSFQARWSEPSPPEIGSSGFVAWCEERLRHALPIHRWLVKHRP